MLLPSSGNCGILLTIYIYIVIVLSTGSCISCTTHIKLAAHCIRQYFLEKTFDVDKGWSSGRNGEAVSYLNQHHLKGPTRSFFFSLSSCLLCTENMWSHWSSLCCKTLTCLYKISKLTKTHIFLFFPVSVIPLVQLLEQMIFLSLNNLGGSWFGSQPEFLVQPQRLETIMEKRTRHDTECTDSANIRFWCKNPVVKQLEPCDTFCSEIYNVY